MRITLIAAFVAAVLWPLSAGAIGPSPWPDQELADQPVIVVGRWNKTPLHPQHHVQGSLLVKWEVRTELLVERVVRGDVKPGVSPILLQMFVGWRNEAGGPIMTFTSTEMSGDVHDVAESNLWFLSRKRSWDPNDKQDYLSVDNFRSAQPLSVETYFLALGSAMPADEMAKLLASEDGVLLRRVVRYLCGDVHPWPFNPHAGSIYGRGVEPRHAPLVNLAPEVLKLTDRKDPALRRLGIAAYAQLGGNSGHPKLRELLKDPDAQVRGITAGALLRRQFDPSGAEILEALRGIDDANLGCKLVDLLEASRSASVVPALIEFLESDGFVYRSGDDWGVPALRAQLALKRITQVDFPPDVEAARRAWSEFQKIPDGKPEQLAALLQYDAHPFKAELVPDADDYAVELTNRSDKPATIATTPDDIEFRQQNAGGAAVASLSVRDTPERRATPFKTLKPGESLRIPLANTRRIVTSHSSIYLTFIRNGRKLGHKAWVGGISVGMTLR